MPSSGSFLRQLSTKEGWKSTSNRWEVKNRLSLKQMEGFNMYGGSENVGGFVMRKRVMVVVDQSSHSKHAMMWALTHVTNKGDMLTLLHIVPPTLKPSGSPSPSSSFSSSSSSTSSFSSSSSSSSPYLASSLGSLCKACKPEVEVEALVIQGPKLATVMSQVKKLEVSVLVLGQKKPSLLFSCLCGTSSRSEEFAEKCINKVKKKGISIRTRF